MDGRRLVSGVEERWKSGSMWGLKDIGGFCLGKVGGGLVEEWD